MGQYGYKIRNFKAATVLAYNMGLRDHYDYTGAMLHHSLFTRFLESAGMKIYNGESTRDVVCMDFGFGLRGFEDEFDHVHDMLRKAQEDGNDELASYIQSLETRVVENKDKYVKLSKDEIRRIFYEEGVDIVYSHTDRKTGEITDVTIHYRMLYRNASKAKVGQCMFINERLYDAAHDWMTMGICNRMVPGEKAKIVELSAYAPLSTSSIMGTIHISVDSVLILKDQDSLFNTMADVVESEEYESSVREVDEIKTEQNRKKALQAGKTVYRMAYHSVPKIKRRCVVHREKTDVKNTLWDGMALIETNICPDDKVNGMVLLRNHFFKACAFRSRLSLFFGNYCREHGLDYETYTIKDMFGRDVPVKDIKMITTNNAIKWLKFIDLMGGDLESAYNHWRERLIADGEEWGMVKTDHPSKIGDVQQMSYQMVNTLPCSKDDIAKIAETSVSYVEKLKTDNDEFERFLRKHATAVNHYEMLADLYAWNHDFANSRFFANDRRKIISSYVYHLRNGKIAVHGDNLTVCGNPYGLLLYSVGEDYEKDPTLQPEDGVVQVYTTKFDDGEYLCGIRSPQNSANNIGYFVNRKHPLMDQYFDFSPNIMAVNCLHTDIQARMNGEDFDSDFNFVTNQPEMVEAARIAYRDYPTVVNRIEESGVEYRNLPSEYARMDSKMQGAQKAIGGASDSAQLAQSYYWSDVTNHVWRGETQELYNNIVILAVLAQCAIDGCKREYAVDPAEDIARIRSMPCMDRREVYKDEYGRRKFKKTDYPKFMRYTRSIPVTKNGRPIPADNVKESKRKLTERIDGNIVCPMNWLEETLDRIQGVNSNSKTLVDNDRFFVKKAGDTNRRQITKIRQTVEEYDRYIRSHVPAAENDDDWEMINIQVNSFVNDLRKMKIKSESTMNRIIETTLGITLQPHDSRSRQYQKASQYVSATMNLLYKMDPEKFLSNFVRGECENARPEVSGKCKIA